MEDQLLFIYFNFSFSVAFSIRPHMFLSLFAHCRLFVTPFGFEPFGLAFLPIFFNKLLKRDKDDKLVRFPYKQLLCIACNISREWCLKLIIYLWKDVSD